MSNAKIINLLNDSTKNAIHKYIGRDHSNFVVLIFSSWDYIVCKYDCVMDYNIEVSDNNIRLCNIKLNLTNIERIDLYSDYIINFKKILSPILNQAFGYSHNESAKTDIIIKFSLVLNEIYSDINNSNEYIESQNYNVVAIRFEMKNGDFQPFIEYNYTATMDVYIRRLVNSFSLLLNSILNLNDESFSLNQLKWADETELKYFGYDNPLICQKNLNLNSVFNNFLEMSVKYPNSIAVQAGDGKLTYRELKAKAEIFARHLIVAGVSLESLVYLKEERVTNFVVGILSIWLVGGAYVPIQEDISLEMLKDFSIKFGIKYLVCDVAFDGIDSVDISVIKYNFTDSKVGDKVLFQSMKKNHLAYVIFTSGSTGQPKAVGVEHQNLSSYVMAASNKISIEEMWNYAHVSSLCADLGHTSLFLALISGGCIHLLSTVESIDKLLFEQYMQNHNIDFLKIVPSHYRAIFGDEIHENHLPNRRLIFGGEILNTRWTKFFLPYLSKERRVFNHYGPTETTIGSLMYEVEAEFKDYNGLNVPIGKPLENSNIQILDENGQTVPIGVVGEIFISGYGVSRGYLS